MKYMREQSMAPAAVFNKRVLYDPKQIHEHMKSARSPQLSGPICNYRHDRSDDKCLLSVSESSTDCRQPAGQESSIRVIIVEPWSLPKVKIISNTLHAKQEIVGGLIEVVYPFAEQVALILNEEGKLIGLPLNRRYGDDIFAGTFIICGIDEQNAHFASLSEEQVQYYANMFRTIEIYLDPAVFRL